jgi:O-antigen/teichoic acid export membrane protein
VLFRWGVDTAFMRLYYDCTDTRARQQLASTLFLFLLVVNGSLLVAGVVAAPWLTEQLIGPSYGGTLVTLTLANTFVAGFFFLPYHVFRINGEPSRYIAFTFGRSAGTIVLRLLFVIGAGMGVFGLVLADVIVTILLAALLSRSIAPLIRPVFSRSVLREALQFGLPRIPHSLAQQVVGVADRYLLKAFGTLADVGMYSIGATFGLALKLFLSAFEAAWTPFFLGVMREKDGARILSTVSTYVIAVLALLVAGLSALATDVVALATAPAFHGAAIVTPWIAIGVMFQGLYLIGSIGLVITKKTTIYPISTGIAAAVSVVANVLLIPRFGLLGAAWANVAAYATLAGVTTVFSWRLYPVPYEWGRLARVAAAASAGYLVATRVVPGDQGTVPGLFARGMATVLVYVIVLAVSGFFHAGELKVLRDMRRRVSSPAKTPVVGVSSTEVEMAGEILASAPELDPADGGRVHDKKA